MIPAMHVLAISTSPRAKGNTTQLLDHMLQRSAKQGASTEMISLSGKSIVGCRACGACRKNQDKKCAIKDDDFHPIFERMQAADVLLVGSPVFFGSATPEAMALLDRAGYVSRSNGNLFARKIGSPIVVARRAGHNFTFAQLLLWYMINGLVVPGSSYWAIAFGRAEGEVLSDAEGMKTAEDLVDNLLWLGAKTKG